MSIITPEMLTALNTGFSAAFTKGLTQAPSDYKKIATVVPSLKSSNTYSFLGKFPGFREWLGERQIKDMKSEAYQLTNKTYESTVDVSINDVEDDNIGIYGEIVVSMGNEAAILPDKLVFALLSAGLSTPCYDGENFFSTNHQVYKFVDGTGTSETVSNFTSGTSDAWYLMDASRPLKPLLYQERLRPEFSMMTDKNDEVVFTADCFRYGAKIRGVAGFSFWQMAHCCTDELTLENFNTIYAAIQSIKGNGGTPLGLKPSLLIVPPSLRADALKLIECKYGESGASNVNFDVVDVLVTPWIV